MENLKEINDQYQWIYRVIESCSTLDQIEGVHNLINRFAEKYPKHTILKDMLVDTANHRSSTIIDINQFETRVTDDFFERLKKQSNKTEFAAHTTSIGLNLTRILLGLKSIDENGNYVKDEVAVRQFPDSVGETISEHIAKVIDQASPNAKKEFYSKQLDDARTDEILKEIEQTVVNVPGIGEVKSCPRSDQSPDSWEIGEDNG